MQRKAAQCSARQHGAAQGSTVQREAARRSIWQHRAAFGGIVQLWAALCSFFRACSMVQASAGRCSARQHGAAQGSTEQHLAASCSFWQHCAGQLLQRKAASLVGWGVKVCCLRNRTTEAARCLNCRDTVPIANTRQGQKLYGLEQLDMWQ